MAAPIAKRILSRGIGMAVRVLRRYGDLSRYDRFSQDTARNIMTVRYSHANLCGRSAHEVGGHRQAEEPRAVGPPAKSVLPHRVNNPVGSENSTGCTNGCGATGQGGDWNQWGSNRPSTCSSRRMATIAGRFMPSALIVALPWGCFPRIESQRPWRNAAPIRPCADDMAAHECDCPEIRSARSLRSPQACRPNL